MSDAADRWRRWERTRQMGRRRFVWLVGVGGWGVSTAVLWSVGFWYFMPPGPSFWAVLPLALVAFSVGGYVWGAAMWWWTEKRYQAAMRGEKA